MSKPFDHLPPYQYRGHTLEAKALHHDGTESVRWIIRIDDVWLDGFPARFDDTEADVRRSVEEKVHQHLFTHES